MEEKGKEKPSLRDEIATKAPVVIIIGLFMMGLILFPLINLWTLPFFIMAGIFLIACLRNIPATPPHVGLVTIWGTRRSIVKKEGWIFLAPFFPFFYDVILINVEKKNEDFTSKEVRSKDKAELAMEISITFAPDKSPAGLIEYINTGGKEAVVNILDDIMEEKIREFAIKRTWEQCLESNVEIVELLIKEIAGGDVDIGRIRRGNGLDRIDSLGIVLNRLNLGVIKVKGKLLENAERVAIEAKQREAEYIEIKHVINCAKGIGNELGISSEEAIQVVQKERGKVQKDIKEFKGLEGIGVGISAGLAHVFTGLPKKTRKKRK